MKTMIRQPEWIRAYDYSYTGLHQIPPAVFDEINARLDKIHSEEPVVSIVIAAWNEEINILKTIASLSRSRTRHPLEIVVVNNNSTDQTQKVLDSLHIRSCFQPVQGWGPARQMGMEAARGKYILMADADCIYPPTWVEDMTNLLGGNGVACVYGRYSFIEDAGFPRWKLFMLEKMKDVVAELRHYKRPYLNAYGMSMGFVREYGLKVGFVMHKIRGEDGRMCFDLMQYGKVKQLRIGRARVWTKPRTLQRDGSFTKALMLRLSKELKRLHTLLKPYPMHDTKTSTNEG